MREPPISEERKCFLEHYSRPHSLQTWFPGSTAGLQVAIKDLRCDDLTKGEAGLKLRYRRNQSVLNALQISQDWTPG
jgi:hypothetical protein